MHVLSFKYKDNCTAVHLIALYPNNNVGCYLADLGMAVAEVELLYAVVDLLLTDDGQGLTVRRVEPAMHERRVVVVESAFIII